MQARRAIPGCVRHVAESKSPGEPGTLAAVTAGRDLAGAFDVKGYGEPDESSRMQRGLAFYRRDYGLDLGDDDKILGTRSDFVRGPDGAIEWLRAHGRLFRRE